MIQTKPSLDEIQEFYEQERKSFQHIEELIKNLKDHPNQEPNNQFIYSLLYSAFHFMTNQAGLNAGNIKIIKQLSESVDNSAKKKDLEQKIESIEQKVNTTLVPLDELVKQGKEIQSRDNSDAYTR